jgi:hypothetical protein
MLRQLEATFPNRSMPAPMDSKTVGQKGACLASSDSDRDSAADDDSDCDSQAQDDDNDDDDDDDDEHPDLVDHDDETIAAGSALARALRTVFGMPKGHACLHVRETIRLYGNLANTSAEPMERKHLGLKKLFQKIEAGPTANLQVLLAVMKQEQALSEVEGQEEESDADACKGRAGNRKRPRSGELGAWATAAVNASFGTNLHDSGRRYPVWQAIIEWLQCAHSLTIPAQCSWEVDEARGRHSQRELIIDLAELEHASSSWCQDVPDMQHLRLSLATYLRDNMPSGSLPADVPAGGRMSWAQVTTMCKCVCAYNDKECQHRPRGPGRLQELGQAHLAVHNCLSIRHPHMEGQVCHVSLSVLINCMHRHCWVCLIVCMCK